IPVLESVPQTMNFPADNPMHTGYQWNEDKQHPVLEEADLVLAIDSDIPWIPTKNKPKQDATIYYIDADPLKEDMPLWYIPSKRFYRADSLQVLKQINTKIVERGKKDDSALSTRREEITIFHNEMKKRIAKAAEQKGDIITPEFLTACVKELVDENTVVMNETITNFGVVTDHIGPSKTGSHYSSGAGSLGWNGGAAIGVKLAHP